MSTLHVTRSALIAAEQWAALLHHAVTHGHVRPGWLASVPDLEELAASEWGAQLGALEGLDPAPLVALGADPARVRAVAEAFIALEPTGADLSTLRVRALCRPRPSSSTGANH